MNFQMIGDIDVVFSAANIFLKNNPGQYEKFITSDGANIEIGLKHTKVTTRQSKLAYFSRINDLVFRSQGKRGSFLLAGQIYYWGETF